MGGMPITTPETNTAQGAGFITYARRITAEMREKGRYDAAHKLDTYIGRFAAFTGKGDIPIGDLTPQLVSSYRAWLADKALGRNSIALYTRSLKRVYLRAAADGLAAGGNPFAGIDTSYRPKKEKPGLTLDDIRRIARLDLSQSRPAVGFARDMFLFSVLTHGMTGGDIFRLTRSNIHGDRLTYTPKGAAREVTIAYEPALQEITDRHARPGTPYLFPVITAGDAREQWLQHCRALHNINRNLKTIGRRLALPFPLTMTVAHHSWQSMTRSLSLAQLL